MKYNEKDIRRMYKAAPKTAYHLFASQRKYKLLKKMGDITTTWYCKCKDDKGKHKHYHAIAFTKVKPNTITKRLNRKKAPGTHSFKAIQCSSHFANTMHYVSCYTSQGREHHHYKFGGHDKFVPHKKKDCTYHKRQMRRFMGVNQDHYQKCECAKSLPFAIREKYINNEHDEAIGEELPDNNDMEVLHRAILNCL